MTTKVQTKSKYIHIHISCRKRVLHTSQTNVNFPLKYIAVPIIALHVYYMRSLKANEKNKRR